MTAIDTITIEATDPEAAQTFYDTAFGLGDRLRVRAGAEPTSGFRGFTLSLLVSQPANADALLRSAVDAGATTVRPSRRSMWGYGGVVQAPDGTLWKVATSSKKDTGRATKDVDEIVLLLGTADIVESKRFYVDRGLRIGRSFGRKYAEFAAPAGSVKLALYGRKALAKDAGVPQDGEGSHRLVIGGDVGAFADPDGFVWEGAAA